MEVVRQFINAINELSLWQRIFGWKRIRRLSMQALEEWTSYANQFNELRDRNESISAVNKQVEFENDQLKKYINNQDFKIKQLEDRISEADKEINKFESAEEHRMKEHDERIAFLNQSIKNYQEELQDIRNEELEKEKVRLEEMKKTWSAHETDIEQTIRLLCNRHEVFYEEEVPFKGKPDNTLEICDEYVIFDAKSPGSDDLANFPVYIKSEAEKVKKYIKEKNVRNEIFLVVPTNTIEYLPKMMYDMADYKVYIVSKDALEPIIIALKKRENYEYMQQLSPEERENISRVIGKFFHCTKRKIQVDLYFIREVFELLGQSVNNLPEEILEDANRFEKAEKMNPPMERRSKEISLKKLAEDHEKAEKEAEIRA